MMRHNNPLLLQLLVGVMLIRSYTNNTNYGKKAGVSVSFGKRHFFGIHCWFMELQNPKYLFCHCQSCLVWCQV